MVQGCTVTNSCADIGESLSPHALIVKATELQRSEFSCASPQTSLFTARILAPSALIYGILMPRSFAKTSSVKSVTDPVLLLADEPTGDLDRKAGDEILDLLQALNRDHGKTIVMVTHDPRAADRAKRTLHLEKGLLMGETR
jgi:ABC-type thiamine transport system ATPase subunit